MKPKAKNLRVGLEGLFFHSFSNNKHQTVQYQGHIIQKIDKSHYLVQLYDWLLGQEYVMKLVTIHEMTSWQFYETDEDMNYEYKNCLKYRMDHQFQEEADEAKQHSSITNKTNNNDE